MTTDRRVILAILLGVGLLSLIMPMLSTWDPENAKMAYGLGFGCLVAFIYFLLSGIQAQMEVRNEPRAISERDRDRDKEKWTSASSKFSKLKWYDWLGIGIPVFGGLLIGAIV